MRALAFAVVLALGSTGGLAQRLGPRLDASPFGERWRVKGVTVSSSGHGISLRWPAAAYQHQLPGRRAIEWQAGETFG